MYTYLTSMLYFFYVCMQVSTTASGHQSSLVASFRCTEQQKSEVLTGVKVALAIHKDYFK